MPRRYNVPYPGPPSWLDARAELPLKDSPTYPHRAAFVLASMTALMALGCSVRQAAEVTANAALEGGWGHNVYWNNAGGWKITRAYADGYRERTGGCPLWWKSPGNVDSADSPWCFYRAFPSLEAFLAEWLAHFVPRADHDAPYPGYKTAGAQFWANDPRWFGSLICVGYKGGPSKLRMLALRAVGADDVRHPSVRDHRVMVDDVLDIWAQSHLGIDADGAWGPKSRETCAAWQMQHGLPVTGELDDATLASLV
jgi:hypothetical protein